MNEQTQPPVRVEESWGVELTDFGPVEYYRSREEAAHFARKWGTRVVRTVTEFYEVDDAPEEADQ